MLCISVNQTEDGKHIEYKRKQITNKSDDVKLQLDMLLMRKRDMYLLEMTIYRMIPEACLMQHRILCADKDLQHENKGKGVRRMKLW